MSQTQHMSRATRVLAATVLMIAPTAWVGGQEWVREVDGGLGDVANVVVASMTTFNGTVVAGTFGEAGFCEVRMRAYGGPFLFWIQANVDGFGGQNRSCSSMAQLGSNLYVGTGNATYGCEVWKMNSSGEWSIVRGSGFGDPHNQGASAMAVYNGKLYVGTVNIQSGCEIWEYDGSNWQLRVTGGHGDAGNSMITSMAIGGVLYAATYNMLLGSRILYTSDGVSWYQVATSGLGDLDYLLIANPGAILYAADNSSGSTAARVWRLNGSEWLQINTDGFGDPDNTRIKALKAFNGKLYAATENDSTGTQVWCYDHFVWHRMSTNGFGHAHNWVGSSITVLGQELFVGTSNFQDGAEIWVYPQVFADDFESGDTSAWSSTVP